VVESIDGQIVWWQMRQELSRDGGICGAYQQLEAEIFRREYGADEEETLRVVSTDEYLAGTAALFSIAKKELSADTWDVFWRDWQEFMKEVLPEDLAEEKTSWLRQKLPDISIQAKSIKPNAKAADLIRDLGKEVFYILMLSVATDFDTRPMAFQVAGEDDDEGVNNLEYFYLGCFLKDPSGVELAEAFFRDWGKTGYQKAIKEQGGFFAGKYWQGVEAALKSFRKAVNCPLAND